MKRALHRSSGERPFNPSTSSLMLASKLIMFFGFQDRDLLSQSPLLDSVCETEPFQEQPVSEKE